MSGATPRVLQQHLQEFVGRTVRLVGRVEQLHGDTAIIDAGGPVTVHLNPESRIRSGHAAEIVAKVKNDLSLQSMQAMDFGDNLDYAAANAVAEIGFKYPDLFHAASSTHATRSYHNKTPASIPAKPPEAPDSGTAAVRFSLIEQVDDAQLLLNEMEEFELSQKLKNTGLEDFEDIDDADLEGVCIMHVGCTLRHENDGGYDFEVHELDGEELWLCISKHPRQKRRKSYV